jgi:signal transduction histidine kinase
LIAAHDEERRRIQRYLHDGLGPVLASIRLRLEACLEAAQPGDAELARELERLYELIGQATGEIRRLVYDLRPPVLDQLGLIGALDRHRGRIGRETGIEVTFEAEDGLHIPAAAEPALLRVAQEALTNVGKHANASHAAIRLTRQDGAIVLSVRDNGVGFDARAAPPGTGLASIRERADLLGGALVISTQPGRGTELKVRIPVREGLP